MNATFAPIVALHLDWRSFVEVASFPVSRSDVASRPGSVIVVSGAPDAGRAPAGVARALAAWPAVVILEGDTASPPLSASVADVVASGSDLDAVIDTVTTNPVASTCLAMLLRSSEDRTVAEGLVAESATYSALQSGGEFRRWIEHTVGSDRLSAPVAAGRATVAVERRGQNLDVTLDRPEVHNALDAQMRDELYEALQLALGDPELAVTIAGNGASFCSGGDLSEFTTAHDPAVTHLVRLARNLGQLVYSVRARVTVHLHGACIGAGIEIPAFAGRIVAANNTSIGLPEITMGLIPGAGGTVSVSRRAGRLRAAWLAFTGNRISASTARSWGLVDEISDCLADPADLDDRRLEHP